MTARKPATKSTVAANRNGSKPVASFSAPKAAPRISGTATGRVSSSTANYEEVPRDTPALHIRQPETAAESLVKRDTLQDAIARAYESLSGLHQTIEATDHSTRLFRSEADPFAQPPEFAVDGSLLASVNQIAAHIRHATAQLESIRRELDL